MIKMTSHLQMCSSLFAVSCKERAIASSLYFWGFLNSAQHESPKISVPTTKQEFWILIFLVVGR